MIAVIFCTERRSALAGVSTRGLDREFRLVPLHRDYDSLAVSG
jgi:hypothetical protein